jgi:hypothetical protein
VGRWTIRFSPWHRWPGGLLGAVYLSSVRKRLRRMNLADTGLEELEDAAAVDARWLRARHPEGRYNDLARPLMGSRGTRFGRNVPIERTFPGTEAELMRPNPRVVSRELLARRTFIPATSLNLLAAAWIQFMVHGWISHGDNEPEDPWRVPLDADDPWPAKDAQGRMMIKRSIRDTERTERDYGRPPTYRNITSHWWDASQVYGSDAEKEARVRSGVDGKLLLEDGRLPMDHEKGIEVTGFMDNMWVGLSLLHTLFALEHNAICDMLKARHPDWTDDELFDHAKLINAALQAKIHTVEWTPGILAHPALKIGMTTNWFGIVHALFGERAYKLVRRTPIRGEVITGIPGSKTAHYGVPYTLTEEFASVYRLHSLVPDEFQFRSIEDDRPIGETLSIREVQGRATRPVVDSMGFSNLMYSFGTSHPGAITLHNYPNGLREIERLDGTILDLAATDIFRDRERGVPRYNDFRELFHLPRVGSFEELTDNPEWQQELKRVYEHVDDVDLQIGMLVENPPKGFGFSETAFHVFILMASRRLNSDRFFTKDYTPEVYTQEGLDWVERETMSSVLLRHLPELEPSLKGVANAFAPWNRVSAS